MRIVLFEHTFLFLPSEKNTQTTIWESSISANNRHLLCISLQMFTRALYKDLKMSSNRKICTDQIALTYWKFVFQYMWDWTYWKFVFQYMWDWTCWRNNTRSWGTNHQSGRCFKNLKMLKSNAKYNEYMKSNSKESLAGSELWMKTWQHLNTLVFLLSTDIDVLVMWWNMYNEVVLSYGRWPSSCIGIPRFILLGSY